MAAQTALELAPTDARALRAMGFIRFWSEGDKAGGLALLKRALDADPNDAQSYHWYGTALLGDGRFTESLAALAKARTLNPGSSSIASAEAFVSYLIGDRAGATAALERIIQLDPNFAGAHSHLERFALAEGKAEHFLREAAISARLKKDDVKAALIAKAHKAYDRGGKPMMLAALIDDAKARFERDEGTALLLARLYAAVGDRSAVLYWLRQAESRREPDIGQIIAYPDFVSYRNDPAFADFFNRR